MKTIFSKTMSVVLVSLFITSCNKKTASPSKTQAQENVQSKAPNSQRSARTGKMPEFKNILSRVDTNNDGKIAKSEAKGRLVDAFEKLDVNSDGFITETEFNEVTAAAQKQ